jgi:hypothetical protein
MIDALKKSGLARGRIGRDLFSSALLVRKSFLLISVTGLLPVLIPLMRSRNFGMDVFAKRG